MNRPMMTISGEPQILLKPMRAPAINTSTVVFTTVPFLEEHAHAADKRYQHKSKRTTSRFMGEASSSNSVSPETGVCVCIGWDWP